MRGTEVEKGCRRWRGGALSTTDRCVLLPTCEEPIQTRRTHRSSLPNPIRQHPFICPILSTHSTLRIPPPETHRPLLPHADAPPDPSAASLAVSSPALVISTHTSMISTCPGDPNAELVVAECPNAPVPALRERCRSSPPVSFRHWYVEDCNTVKSVPDEDMGERGQTSLRL